MFLHKGEMRIQQFKRAQPHIGHIQFAGVPDRSEPHSGTVDYPTVLHEISEAGWTGYFGAEYRPKTTTEDGLGWMKDYL